MLGREGKARVVWRENGMDEGAGFVMEALKTFLFVLIRWT